MIRNTNSWLISLVASLILTAGTFWLGNFESKKYSLNQHYTYSYYTSAEVKTGDLDGDGIDEFIVATSPDEVNSKIGTIGYYHGNETGINRNVIDNTPGRDRFPNNRKLIIFRHPDGLDHILAFRFKDSLLFLEHQSPKDFQKPQSIHFLDTIRFLNGHENLLITEEIKYDLDGDGIDEILFSLLNGWSIYPRKIYVYYPRFDSIHHSKNFYYPPKIFNIDQLNNKLTIAVGNGSPCNVHDPEITFHDCKPWVTLLNNQLELIDTPISLDSGFDCHSNLFLRKNNIYCFINNPSRTKSFLMRGHSVKTLTDTFVRFQSRITDILIEQKEGLAWYREFGTNNWVIMDSNWSIITSFEYNGFPLSPLFYDLNGDGNLECVMVNPSDKTIDVFSSDGKYQTSHASQISTGSLIRVEVKHEKDQNKFIVSTGNRVYCFSLTENAFYHFRYVNPILLFLGFFAFMELALYLNRKRILKKVALEQEMHRLQLISIKNQVDPHFTLNALNSIDHLYQSGQNHIASKYMTRLSRLVHSTLLSSESINTSLEDEMEFCMNYMEIEKIRDEHFQYQLQMEEGIEHTLILKHLIFTFVENAIKHGLRPSVKKDKLLQIDVRRIRNLLSISISDNGLGSRATTDNGYVSTGKGLKILEQMRHIYFQLYKKEIEIDFQQNNQGTKVKITMNL